MLSFVTLSPGARPRGHVRPAHKPRLINITEVRPRSPTFCFCDCFILFFFSFFFVPYLGFRTLMIIEEDQNLWRKYINFLLTFACVRRGRSSLRRTPSAGPCSFSVIILFLNFFYLEMFKNNYLSSVLHSFQSDSPEKVEKKKKRKALYLSASVFGTKVLIEDTGDATTILRGHPSHAKVQPFAGQRK